MVPSQISDPLPSKHPLSTLRRLTDQALDDLGGLVAPGEAADADGLTRRAVRLVLLQALCGLRADAELARRLCSDEDCRGFVGLPAGTAGPSAADCAQVRHSVLGVQGFAEFLCVLLDIFERRGLLADAMFVLDRGLLRGVSAGGTLLAPAQ